MTTAIAEAPTRVHRRSRALDPYVRRLKWLCRQKARRGAEVQALEIEVGGRPLVIEGWVLDGVRDDEDPEPASEHALPLRHTAALLIKIAADRVRLDRCDPAKRDGFYTVQAELMLDAAMSAALKREIQSIVDGDVARGEIASAKRWTKLKNDLHSASAGLRDLLEASERRQADALSDKLTDQPRETPAAEAAHYGALMRRIDEAETHRKREARAKRLATAALVDLPSRTELLVVALALGLVTWLAFVKAPAFFATELPMLTASDIPGGQQILAIDAVPPSVYVTVDELAWSALDEDERSRFVRGLSSALLTHGYSGAAIRTESGRPVAQWLMFTGTRVFDPLEGPPLPAALITP